jgi:hypothetical protein
MEDTESKFHKLAFLAHDFQHAAEGLCFVLALFDDCERRSRSVCAFACDVDTVYGKIIISERYLPYEEKTLKPEKDMG